MFSRTGLGAPDGRQGTDEVRWPCEPLVAASMFRAGTWYHTVCHVEGGGPSTTVESVRPEISFAGPTSFAGCTPEAIAPLDDGVLVLTRCGDADALLAYTARELPDIVVTDIRMPPTHTDEGLRERYHYLWDYQRRQHLVKAWHIEGVSEAHTDDVSGKSLPAMELAGFVIQATMPATIRALNLPNLPGWWPKAANTATSGSETAAPTPAS